MSIVGESTSRGRENISCKGPKMRMNLVNFRNIDKAHIRLLLRDCWRSEWVKETVGPEYISHSPDFILSMIGSHWSI